MFLCVRMVLLHICEGDQEFIGDGEFSVYIHLWMAFFWLHTNILFKQVGDQRFILIIFLSIKNTFLCMNILLSYSTSHWNHISIALIFLCLWIYFWCYHRCFFPSRRTHNTTNIVICNFITALWAHILTLSQNTSILGGDNMAENSECIRFFHFRAHCDVHLLSCAANILKYLGRQVAVDNRTYFCLYKDPYGAPSYVGPILYKQDCFVSILDCELIISKIMLIVTQNLTPE